MTLPVHLTSAAVQDLALAERWYLDEAPHVLESFEQEVYGVPVLGLLPHPSRVDRNHRRRAPIPRPEDMATASLGTEREGQEDS